MSKSNSSQVKKLMDRGQVTRSWDEYQVGSIVKLTENNDWEMTVPKNNNRKPVINGQPLFSLRNNVPKGSGR